MSVNSIASYMDKPNILPFNDFALKNAAFLYTEAEFESDRTLRSLIRVQRVVEATRDTYGSIKLSSTPSRLHLHVQRLLLDLEECKYSFPQISGYASKSFHSVVCGEIVTQAKPDYFTTGYHTAKIRILEMGLVYHFGPRVALNCKDLAAEALARTNDDINRHLTSCVDAIRDSLNALLATDPALDIFMPLEENFRIIMSFFVAYKLSVKLIEVPQWDVNVARETFDLHDYLGRFMDRFRASQTSEDFAVASAGHDIYSLLPDVLESARNSYLFARSNPDAVDDKFQVHVDLGAASKASAVPKVQKPSRGQCPATSFWTAEAMQVDMLDRYEWLSPSLEDSTITTNGMPFDAMHGDYSNAQLWPTSGTNFTDPDQVDWFAATGVPQQHHSFSGPFG